MKVRWTREAANEMKQILAHLQEVNPPASRKIRNMVLGFVDMISSMPYIAPAYQENRPLSRVGGCLSIPAFLSH